MKTRFVAPLLLAAVAVPAHAYDYADTADVIAATPIYQTVNNPRQQCWTESVTAYEQPRRAGGGAIIGGIAGGLIGSTVGRGNGRVAAAAAGAAIGALVGNDYENRDNAVVAVTRPVQRCQVTDNYSQVITGYNVTYRYNGRDSTVVLPNDPGPRLRIGVGVVGANTAVEVIPPVATVRYVQPVVTHFANYEDRDIPVWRHRPYKRPRLHHDDD
jgi:uncharacterized protein YcfJ